MKNLWYLFAGYMVIWVIIGGYHLKLSSRLEQLEQKIKSIKGRKQ